MLALLIDADGYVLSLTGSERTMVEARRINFMEGSRWTETDVGTNAIGTALVIGEAVTINGTEHFSIASHHWSCSAAPIRDADGTIIGVIDISCMTDNKHPFMLGMASTVAYAIEREIQVQQRRREMELITHCLQQVEADEPYVVCNEKSKLCLPAGRLEIDFQTGMEWMSIGLRIIHLLFGESRSFNLSKTGRC